MDVMQSRPWRTFVHELQQQGIEFEMVQHADDATRSQLLQSIASLTAIDRAVVSSAWAKMQHGGGGGGGTPLAAGSPQRDDSFRGQPMHLSPSMSAQGFGSPVQQQQQYGASAGPMPGQQFTPPPSLGAASGGGVDSKSLRAALSRGDSTVALPAASAMLQSDPAALVAALHDYLPHMSVDQIKAVLGLNVGEAPQQSRAPAAGDAAAAEATLNGTTVPLGQVLTAESLAARYGGGFTATNHGLVIALPHCVQRGDAIVVRSHDDRQL
jgi:hypothetical protein